jgi:hypothetical protein
LANAALINRCHGSCDLLHCLGAGDLRWTGRTLRTRTACAGRMASACSTASAAACCRSRVVAPTIGAGTCIGTRVAKAGARRQSDTDPARKSPFDRATTHRYPSGEAAGTGTHRTAAGWNGSILIRRRHDRARSHSCAFPNQPKQPIVPPGDALPAAVAKRYEAHLTYQARIRGASIYPAVQNIILACRARGLGTLITTRVFRRYWFRSARPRRYWTMPSASRLQQAGSTCRSLCNLWEYDPCVALVERASGGWAPSPRRRRVVYPRSRLTRSEYR